VQTGVESIVYICCGTTDLPMYGHSYATERVEHFISEVLKINNTDFIGKMKEFAIQGLKGMPSF